MDIAPEDLADLRQAVQLLEPNHLAASLTKLVGKGVNGMVRMLPSGAETLIQEAAGKALQGALKVSVKTVDTKGRHDGWISQRLKMPWFDKAAVMLSGVGGGLGGLAGTLVELPVTTTLMFRGIVQIAVREGEDVDTPEGRAECLKVFAFGGPSSEDDDTDLGYYAVRLGLADLIGRNAGRSASQIAPRLLAAVASRFGVPVTWKFAGQAVPGIGAVAGAAINLAFIDAFQKKAHGHFIVRRLERRYGAETVHARYLELRESLQLHH